MEIRKNNGKTYTGSDNEHENKTACEEESRRGEEKSCFCNIKENTRKIHSKRRNELVKI